MNDRLPKLPNERIDLDKHLEILAAERKKIDKLYKEARADGRPEPKRRIVRPAPEATRFPSATKPRVEA